MLLVQHPQSIPMSPSLMPSKFNSHSHRRIPSAPAAVVHVQPTKVPGLLSLSKPLQQHPRAGAATGRHATPRQHKSKGAPAPVSPDSKQQQRGRASPPAKDKAARSSSKPRAGHGRRAHQPSPSPLHSPTEQMSSPIPSPFSSAVPATDDAIISKNPFATLPKTSTPSPVLSAPAGRLAKRRNRGVIPFPQADSSPSPASKSKQSPSPSPKPGKPVVAPMDVPQTKRESRGLEPQLISRSQPVKSSFPRVAHRRSKVDLNSGELVFPVCIDDSDCERPSTPSPIRTQMKGLKGSSSMTDVSDQSVSNDSDAEMFGLVGSLTAPPSTVRRTFATSTPTPARTQPKRRPGGHKRAPSDSMYNLPFESDSELMASTSLDLRKFDADSSAFYGGVRRPRLQSTSRTASTPNGKGQSGVFAYASSSFQNSPSPDDLPPPSFQFATSADASFKITA